MIRQIFNCKSLSTIVIPDSVKYLGNYAFHQCDSLTSVKLSESLTSISRGLFQECYNLSSIEIPNNVKNIGSNSFSHCTRLSSIKIPDGVNEIESGVFWNCYKLDSIEIPNSVTSIGDNAFYYCTRLSSLSIGQNVSVIGGGAFTYCIKLKAVRNYAISPQEIVANVFNNVNISQCTLYVPQESLTLYQTAKVWKDFLIEPLESTATSISENSVLNNKKASKILRDGEIVILRGEKEYTLQGQEIK